MVAGAAKLSRPADLLGFRTAAPLVRLAGASEAAIGVAALALGGLFAWAVGLLYASFAVIVLRATRSGARSCGCFGRLDAPPSWVHVVGNLSLAAACLAAAATGATAEAPVAALAAAFAEQPATAAALVVEIAVLAGLALAALTALPEALDARRPQRDNPNLFRALETERAGERARVINNLRPLSSGRAEEASAAGLGGRR